MLSLFVNLKTRFQRDETGATAVEYGIMVGLIAVAIIVVVSTLGGQLTGLFQDVSTQLGGTTTETTTTP